MDGLIKKFKDNNDNYFFPVTLSDAVFIDKKTTLADKLYADRLGPGSLIIDLERWGITQGLPNKPYQNNDYITANNNVLAFNRIINYAYNNSINEIILPRGNYSVCYPTTIEMKDNITLNLNGSTIKVIYDSDNISPFDTRTTTDYYNFAGILFGFTNCYNAHIKNGKIFGDSYDRSFINANEKAMESTYGITIRNSSSFCTIRHCEISGFMGDCINFQSGGNNRGGIIGGQQLGDLNTSGAIISSTNTLVTASQPIPTGQRFFAFNGQGYSRTTSLNKKYFDVFYYKADGAFIGSYLKAKIQTNISIPPNASTLKFKFYAETDPAKNMNIFVDWGGIPHHNTVEYCDIYNGHRGGITGGGNYCTIQHCYIRENGKYSNTWFDGIPTFPDTTRYAFNQEDSYGDNTIIRNNVISGSFNGILIRSHTAYIENNIFYNMDSSSITIYSMSFGKITGNYFYSLNYNRAIEMFGGNEFTPINNITISDNYIMGGMKLDTTGYDVIVKGNVIFPGSIALGNSDFQNNHIVLTNDTNFKNLSTGGTIKNCRFYAMDPTITPQPEIQLNCDLMDSCTFKNISVRLVPASGTASIPNSNFSNCYVYTPSKAKVNYKNTNFIDSQLAGVGVSLGTGSFIDYSYTTADSCTFQSTISNTYNSFFLIYSNMNRCIRFVVTNSSFIIDNSNFLSFVTSHYVGTGMGRFTLKSSNITYTGATALTSSYYDADIRIYDSILANIQLNNIVMNVSNTNPTFIFYDPDIESINEPISGSFKLKQTLANVNPIAGGYLGWVCIKAGVASNIAWAASTAYAIDALVNVNGNVYKCTVAGTSGSTAPSATSGSTTDGGVTWQYQGLKAVFKRYGLIES